MMHAALKTRAPRIAIVAAAATGALAPIPAELVERYYSTGAYPWLQRGATATANLVPFALFDLLIVGVVGAWIVVCVADLRGRPGTWGGWLRALGRVAARTIVWASMLYVVFLFTWGMNYRRTPLAEKLRVDASAATPASARALALISVAQVNRLYPAAHDVGASLHPAADATLAGALDRAARQLGGAGGVVVGRPKTTALDWFFRRTATDGMTDPYFLETLVSTSLLPFERPFVLAHEWSHLAGVADEGDANFLAWLACVHASEPAQYSGWLFLFSEVAGSLDPAARAEVAALLAPGPRADLVAIRARVTRDLSPQLAAASRLIYDRYLKANRIEAGVQSYGRVVELVLGSRFDAAWNVVVSR